MGSLSSLATLINQYGIAAVLGGGGGGAFAATGGIISDYEDSGTYYRAHIFNSTSTFEVISGTADIDVLSVGGGGAGGYSSQAGSGGGGGGVHYKTLLPASVGSYPVVIGAGGATGSPTGGATSSPLVPFIAAGGGQGGQGAGQSGNPGASGGGGVHPGSAGGTATGAPSHPQGIDIVSPEPNANGWGSPGAAPGGGYAGDGSGGGGAGGAGLANGTTSLNPGDGGYGVRYSIAYGPTNVISYGGGGSGGVHNGPGSADPSVPAALKGGGGDGGGNASNASGAGGPATSGTAGLGGGGGGAGNLLTTNGCGLGGSGTFIVRYQIPASTGTAKATGGAISYYGGKTIHTFTSSGTFAVTNGPLSVEFFMVAGGGGAGFDASGGGGGGGVVHHPGLTVANGSYPLTIGAGGRGAVNQSEKGGEGTSTTINFPEVYTAYRGGVGGSRNTSPGGSGGSGGGGGRLNGTAGPALQPAGNSGATEYGNAGGAGGSYGAGGGGAGFAGQPYADYPNRAGWGGIGIQAPSTFQNPDAKYGGSVPGTPGNAWGFAGGGGGGGINSDIESYGGAYGPGGRIPGGPYYGGGTGAIDPPSVNEFSTAGQANTGGGGGGGCNVNARGEAGGSGIVLIAYPT